MKIKKRLFVLVFTFSIFVGGVHASSDHALEEHCLTEDSGKATLHAAAMCGAAFIDKTSHDVEVNHSMTSNLIAQLTAEIDQELETNQSLRVACVKYALGAAMAKIHDHPALTSLTLSCFVDPDALISALTPHLRGQRLNSLGLCARTLVGLLAQDGFVEDLKKCHSLSRLNILDITLRSHLTSILETIKELPLNIHLTLSSFESGFGPSLMTFERAGIQAMGVRGFQSLTLESGRIHIGNLEEDFHGFLTGRTRPGRLTIKGDLCFDKPGLPFINDILGHCLDGHIVLEGRLLYREGYEYVPLQFADPHVH